MRLKISSETEEGITKKFYSVKQAAEFCGISPRLIYLKVKEREIRFYKINSKIIFDKEDLVEFVTRNEFRTGEELLRQLKEKKMVRS